MPNMGPAEFFLSLKAPTKEKQANRLGLAKMTVKKQAKRTAKKQLRQAGVSTTRSLASAPKKILYKPPKAKPAKIRGTKHTIGVARKMRGVRTGSIVASYKAPKAKLKVAFAEAIARGLFRAGQAGAKKIPEAVAKARSAAGGARAYGSGFAAGPDPGMLKRLKGFVTRKPVHVPSKAAKAKGPEYHKSWKKGKAHSESLGVHETASTLKKQLQNADGKFDPGSVLSGLQRTGIVTSDTLAKAGLGAEKIIGKAGTKRSLMQSRNAQLAAAGVGLAGAGLVGGHYLTKKRASGQVKEAKLRVGDVEDSLGIYLDDKSEGAVRKMIAKAKSKSFSMRHPYLTGIPTLGIAPAIANDNAKAKIVRRLLRSDKRVRGAHQKHKDTEWKRGLEERKLDIEERKADAPAKAAVALGASGLGIAKALADAKKDKNRLKYGQDG